MSRSKSKGFTLVELLVVTIVFGIIAAVLSSIFVSTRRSKIATELITEAQQNARIAIDLMASEIRSAGYGVDWDLEQGAVVHAGPYDIVFNANLNPYPDPNVGAPTAIDTLRSPRQVPPGVSEPLYRPDKNYLTGAETIRYTLDYNNDTEMDSDDRNTGLAKRTLNSKDYLLVKQVYGRTGTSNGGENQGIAILRGPDLWPDQQDSTVPPLFEYWWDNDEDPRTKDSLFGDTNRDGKLSWSEFEFLGDSVVPYPERISSVTINAIGETRSPIRGETYQQVRVSTTVSVMRNPNPKRFTLLGHVYNDLDKDGQFDTGEPGLEGFRISIGAGLYDYTDASGVYEFTLVPGLFTVKASTNPGWDLTTPAETTIEITSHDVDLRTDRHFGMKPIPYGWVQGSVFYDSIPPHNGVFDSAQGERGIEGVLVTVTTQGVDTTTDEEGYYKMKVDCQEDPHIVRETDLPGHISTTPNEYTFYLLPPDSCSTRTRDFGDVPFSGEQLVYVWVPNGGEEWSVGDSARIKFWASDSVHKIDTAQVYLSRHGGADYQWIGTVLNMNLDEPWNASWKWPQVDGPTSDSCKVKVIAWDTLTPPQSGWDESDSLFRITSGLGEAAYYFRTDTSGLYRGADTVRLFKSQPGDNADSAVSWTTGTGVKKLPLFYPYSTQTDSATWVTTAFSQDSSINSGNWLFVLWATVDRRDDPPSPYLIHKIGVKVLRKRPGAPDSTIREVYEGSPWMQTSWNPDTVKFSTLSSVHIHQGDRLWVEVWTERGADVDGSQCEVRFGYNSQPEFKSYMKLPQ